MSGEIAARAALGSVGRAWEYWAPEAATKFEFVRDSIERDRPMKTLIIGDSTAAADLDPATMEQTLGPAAWNAGWPGNFPLAFEQSMLPLLRDERFQAGLLIASFIPSGFTAGDSPVLSESAILGSSYVQRQQAGWLTGDYFHLARLRTAWPFVLDRFAGRNVAESIKRYGFSANDGVVTSAVLAAEDVRDGPSPITPRRMNVMREMLALARAKHIPVVVVIPPSLTRSPQRVTEAAAYYDYLAGEERLGGVKVFDYMRAPFLRSQHFADLNHLNLDGARQLSSDLGRKLTLLGHGGQRQARVHPGPALQQR